MGNLKSLWRSCIYLKLWWHSTERSCFHEAGNGWNPMIDPLELFQYLLPFQVTVYLLKVCDFSSKSKGEVTLSIFGTSIFWCHKFAHLAHVYSWYKCEIEFTLKMVNIWWILKFWGDFLCFFHQISTYLTSHNQKILQILSFSRN